MTYEVRTVTQVETLEQHRFTWESMQLHPNSDIDAYIINIQLLKNVSMPYVLQLFDNGVLKAFLIGRIEESNVEYKIGFKTFLGQRLRQLTIIYQGAIGETSSAVARRFVDEIKHQLVQGKFDAVYFYALKIDSEIYRAANVAGNILTKDHGIKIGQHWKTPLPQNGIDDFLRHLSAKHRYWLRRLPRVLDKAFPGNVSYRRFSDISEVAQLAIDCERIASRTYHRAAGAGFHDNELWRRKLHLWATRGTLHGHILYINNQPCAFWLANLYGKTLHLDFTGYLAEYKKFELGTILFLKMVEHAIAAGAQELDYGLGALWYKERFGGECWAEGSLYLFAPSFKGVTANLTRWAFSNMAAIAKRLLNKCGATGILMNTWRNRLSSQSGEGSK